MIAKVRPLNEERDCKIGDHQKQEIVRQPQWAWLSEKSGIRYWSTP
jgi:hypothetical protein